MRLPSSILVILHVYSAFSGNECHKKIKNMLTTCISAVTPKIQLVLSSGTYTIEEGQSLIDVICFGDEGMLGWRFPDRHDNCYGELASVSVELVSKYRKSVKYL